MTIISNTEYRIPNIGIKLAFIIINYQLRNAVALCPLLKIIVGQGLCSCREILPK